MADKIEKGGSKSKSLASDAMSLHFPDFSSQDKITS